MIIRCLHFKLIVLLLLAANGLAAQEQNEAKALFDRMEAKILKCKSLEIPFTSVSALRDPDRGKFESYIRGKLQITLGKVRQEITSTSHFPPEKRKAPGFQPLKLWPIDRKQLIVSDGLKLVVVSKSGNEDDTYENRAAPKGFAQSMLVNFTRVHMNYAYLTDHPDYGEPASVTGFKLGKKENVAGREAQVVEYIVKIKSEKEESVKVWIDLESHMPLTRFVGKEPDHYVREIYRDARLDVEIAPEVFTLPTKKADKK